MKGNTGLSKYLLNTSWLFSEQIIRMGVSLIVSVWVVRYLGPDRFGLLSYAQSLVTLFAALATLGIDEIVVRELVKKNYSRESLLGTSFILKMAGAISVLLLLFLAVSFTSTDTETKTLVFIIASGTIFQSFNVISLLFQADVNSKFTVQANIAAFAVSTAAKIIMLLLNAPLIAFAAAISIDVAINALGLIYFYRKKHSELLRWRFNKALASNLLKDSWPLILSSISISIGMRIDQVMLKSYMNADSVGIYAAGVRLAEVFNFIPMIVGNSLFPKIVNMDLQQEEKKLINIIRYIFLLLTAMALLVSAFSYITVSTLYGQAYLLSYKVLIILIWTVPVAYLGIITNCLLLKANKGKVIFVRQALVAALNIALNLLLIPVYGIVGAALATFLSMVLVLLLEGFSSETRGVFTLKLKAVFFINR